MRGDPEQRDCRGMEGAGRQRKEQVVTPGGTGSICGEGFSQRKFFPLPAVCSLLSPSFQDLQETGLSTAGAV